MNTIQYQYYLIYSFFETTTEAFDELEWDGNTLNVWLDDKIIEQYTYKGLKKFTCDI